ncbi:PilZ domain-containing protein [Methylobacterium brachythecii]|uniref:PilZ domain-containing protein n=1 Tax=Methylobacterium brachythecii TaxID=1176177 RepID=UPI001612DC0F
MIEERREFPRQDLFKFGFAVVQESSTTYTCMTLNITERGAKIEVEDSTKLPDHFLLAAREDETPRPCRVLWRIGPKMGVVFTD